MVLTGSDQIHNLPGIFQVVKCRNCGLMRTNPRPTPGVIGFYYPDDYGPYLNTQVDRIKPSAGIGKSLKTFASHIINNNTQKIPKLEPGRMLEIGCASGAFLRQMAGQGWQVQGIEFSEKAAQSARQLGYHIHAGSLEAAPDPDKPFDLIVGWMVLEHLHDPIGCLKKLRHWAKPNAWLAISLPNAASLEFRMFKDKWYALQLPNHLHHFTPHTLALVLEASGWSLHKVYHQRVLNNLIASIGYVLYDNGYNTLGRRLIKFPGQAGRLTHVLYPLAWLLSLFGQTGRMTIWARPQSDKKENEK